MLSKSICTHYNLYLYEKENIICQISFNIHIYIDSYFFASYNFIMLLNMQRIVFVIMFGS